MLPYQDILESQPKVATTKPEPTQNSQENKIIKSYESPIYEVERKIKSLEKPSATIDQGTKTEQKVTRPEIISEQPANNRKSVDRSKAKISLNTANNQSKSTQQTRLPKLLTSQEQNSNKTRTNVQ